jgi:dTDP-4-dehydrorhamnose 3,5-epimerase
MMQVAVAMPKRTAERAQNTRLEIREFHIPGLKLIVPKRFEDARGSFSETWSDFSFRREVAPMAFVQDNQSSSSRRGTVRGLHFQAPPQAQGKLLRVLRGSILDIAVDIRHGSPTYGQHVATTLSSADGAQLWVPPGFLHGFCTLEDQTEIFYKVTAYYSPALDCGVLWKDPDLAIEWPVGPDAAVLSDKDLKHPRLQDIPRYFTYDGDSAERS